jgi:hypothetical protein
MGREVRQRRKWEGKTGQARNGRADREQGGGAEETRRRRMSAAVSKAERLPIPPADPTRPHMPACLPACSPAVAAIVCSPVRRPPPALRACSSGSGGAGTCLTVPRPSAQRRPALPGRVAVRAVVATAAVALEGRKRDTASNAGRAGNTHTGTQSPANGDSADCQLALT